MRRLFLVAFLLLCPTRAFAESALLGSLRIGAAYLEQRNTSLAFRLGAGLDWLHAAGPTVAMRLDTTHEIDTTLSLGVGWSFGGLVNRRGIPLGVRIGALAATDLDGAHKLGGRAHLEWGLWANRVTIDLDVDVRHTLGPIRGGERDVVIGVSLRVVPWSPWRL